MIDFILSKLFIGKLYKFFFVRNKRIIQTIISLLIILSISIVYTIVFLINIGKVISFFQTNNYTPGIYLIIILLILIIISVYLTFAYYKLFNQSKYTFMDEISKSYPINSTELITFDMNTITSKNTGNNHMMVFNFTDCVWYYHYDKIYVLQFVEDEYIFMPQNEETTKLIKRLKNEFKIKKKFVLKTSKKEF